MSLYHCGIEGLLSLEDGRIVTSDEPFELDVTTEHDEHLVTSGQIVLLEDAPVAKSSAAALPAPAAQSQNTNGEAE